MRSAKPLLLLAVLALLLALWAGWSRLGWTIPITPALAAAHGPLMISGFFGVLIPLERAVALRQRWMPIVPLVAGLGWIAYLFSFPLGRLLFTLGSLGTLFLLGIMLRREPALHTLVMALGALCWFIGNGLHLLGQPVFRVVFWWMGFLVLTIGGERLELNRVLRLSPFQKRLFAVIVVILLSGAFIALFNPGLGSRVFGLALFALGLWLSKYDLAWRNLRHPQPLTRYMALCLFAGFIWLGIAGLFFILFGPVNGAPLYDAALHALFVGFVLSMIFGHAPVIFPALLNRAVPFNPYSAYPSFILLHASLFARIAGDLIFQPSLRRWGGLLNGVALLLFLSALLLIGTRRQNS